MFQMIQRGGLFLCLLLVGTVFAEDWAWKKDDAEKREGKDLPVDTEEAEIAPANDTQPRHFIKDRLCDLGLGGVSTQMFQY